MSYSIIYVLYFNYYYEFILLFFVINTSLTVNNTIFIAELPI